MREILFRGKQKSSGVWLFGDLRQWSEKRKGICDYNLGRTLDVCPETVGQFTGLYDNTKWEDLTDSEKMAFYKQHYIGKDGMSVRFQRIDDVQHLWKGKKIFEGDILKESDVIHNGETQIIGHIFSVAMRKGCWCVLSQNFFDGWDFLNSHTSTCTVIGNIHDNPELLSNDT